MMAFWTKKTTQAVGTAGINASAAGKTVNGAADAPAAAGPKEVIACSLRPLRPTRRPNRCPGSEHFDPKCAHHLSSKHAE